MYYFREVIKIIEGSPSNYNRPSTSDFRNNYTKKKCILSWNIMIITVNIISYNKNKKLVILIECVWRLTCLMGWIWLWNKFGKKLWISWKLYKILKTKWHSWWHNKWDDYDISKKILNNMMNEITNGMTNNLQMTWKNTWPMIV